MLDAAKALTIGHRRRRPPTITNVTPGQGWRMHGKVTVTTAGVGDAWSGVRNVDLYADGAYKAQDRTAPY